MSMEAAEDFYDDQEAFARSDDPGTSRDAAISFNVSRLQRLVFEIIAAAGFFGATSCEIAAALGLVRDSVSPRIKPLRQKGLVFTTGETRTNPSGRRGLVWKLIAYKYIGESNDNSRSAD